MQSIENGVEVPQKIQNTATSKYKIQNIMQQSPFWVIYPKGMKSVSQRGHLHSHVHCSTIDNSQDTEST